MEYLIAAAILFVMAALVLVLGLCDDSSNSNAIIFNATPIIASADFFMIFMCARRFVIYRDISKIKSLDTQTVKIHCSKVSFITQPISRHTSSIICIIFVDECGKRYYNIIPDMQLQSKKDVKKALIGCEIALDCYKGTNFVNDFRILGDNGQA